MSPTFPARAALAATAAAAAVAALVLPTLTGSGAALADPPSGVTPAHIDIVGTGSDATQYLIDQEAGDWDSSHPTATRQWYSWDALGSPTIVEKANCAARNRPAGSGTGIAELEANIRPAGDNSDYCVDYARSTSGRQATDPGSILYLPYAIDGVTWAADKLTGTTHATASLTTLQLSAIYSCDASLLGNGASGPVKWNEVGGTSNDAVIPVIPISSSGTRKFFLQQINVSTLGSCVLGQDNSVTESEGTNPIFQNPSTAPDIVVPYSAAVYLAQSQNGHGTGNQGSMILRSVNGKSALTGTAPNKKINTNFPYLREIYTVVRNADKTGGTQKVPGYLQPLFGTGVKNTGWLCTNATAKSEIQSYGFLLTPRCGVIE